MPMQPRQPRVHSSTYNRPRLRSSLRVWHSGSSICRRRVLTLCGMLIVSFGATFALAAQVLANRPDRSGRAPRHLHQRHYRMDSCSNMSIVSPVARRYNKGAACDWDNSSFVLEAMKQNANVLAHASNDLKSDRKFMMQAVKQDADAVEFASGEVIHDREIWKEAVKRNGHLLAYAPGEIRRDREIVMEAVKKHGWALRYASDNLKSDREVVLEAVRKDGAALACASKNMRNDRRVVMEAVKNNLYMLDSASKAMMNDVTIVMEAAKKNPKAVLRMLPKESPVRALLRALRDFTNLRAVNREASGNNGTRAHFLPLSRRIDGGAVGDFTIGPTADILEFLKGRNTRHWEIFE